MERRAGGPSLQPGPGDRRQQRRVATGSSVLVAYGQPGPGKWVTAYSGSGGEGHEFIEVAGLVLDTSHQGLPYAPVSVPYQPDPRRRLRPQRAWRPDLGPTLVLRQPDPRATAQRRAVMDRPSPQRALMRQRPITTAAISFVALVLAGCGSHGRSYPNTSRSSTSSSTARVRLTPRSAVVRFAQTYGEYLDGRLPAVRVAEASTIDVGIRIAPDARTGRLQVTSVAPAPLGRPSAFVLRDRTHTIRFTVTIARVHDTFRVRSFTPPDLDSVAQAPPRAIAQPPGSAPAQRTARRFLTRFLAWVYRYGKASAIVNTTPQLAAQLKGPSPARVPARSLDPEVVAIGMVRSQGGGWTAEVNITDSERAYELQLKLVAAGGGWAVSHVREPN